MKRITALVLVLVLALASCCALAEEVTPEFKELMDSYEAFFDDYFTLLEKVSEHPEDFTALLELSAMLEEEAEMMEALDALEDDEDLSAADMAYYLEVYSRILKRMSESSLLY